MIEQGFSSIWDTALFLNPKGDHVAYLKYENFKVSYNKGWESGGHVLEMRVIVGVFPCATTSIKEAIFYSIFDDLWWYCIL